MTIKPIIHLNGTSREDLLEGHIAMMAAVQHAMTEMSANSPNGRDYYPAGENALKQALEEHRDRCARLHSVFKELEEIAEHISDLQAA